ncbi:MULTISPECIES: DUF1003 domain-containing protein [unclassified Parafrankia]|uniref:DUF1003 domain-containing protein n=1 Tax=unclassified Parafrankia TaxID=2994368 RepID=UPI000DA426D1|nr:MULTISPECIES: DUF1003 domain-containing protein [unclassified Parafrankia]TCJ32566.1 DUF1003 domain-containing protein [Parafrankia sp. BMG5.11]SQD97255.1 conserved hypothetical protein [Parafrankia sp. Ea1.12]
MSTLPDQPAAPRPTALPQPPHPRPRPHPRVRNERALAARARTSQDRVSDAITAFAGSMPFVYLHAAWFMIWILLNKGAFGDAAVFDPYPFGLLTMIVSLEAIFLSTFVMISQNRQAAREDIRADLDFETNLRSEVWSVHIGKALGLDAEAIERHAAEVIAESKAMISRGETSSRQVTPPAQSR